MKIICTSCGKEHSLSLDSCFAGCECGAKLSEDLEDLLKGVHNSVIEFYTTLDKRCAEGVSSKFELQI